MSRLKYFKVPILFSLLGALAAYFVGTSLSHSSESPLRALYFTFILCLLEVSFSFDNAVINGLILKRMTPLWQKRFLTWGILIAVFGMRLIFPLTIVSVLGKISPWSALNLAIKEPDQYAEMMLSVKESVSAFGGIFLLLVSLNFFFNENENFWIGFIERPLSRLKNLRSIKLGVALLVLYLLHQTQDASVKEAALLAGIWGLVVFIVVNTIERHLNGPKESQGHIARASAGLFLYLELMDASFSFDGVIGAFAITHNVFIMMIGLGVGAFYVRSLTVLLVKEDKITKYEFLKHGAYYAIGSLSTCMLLSTFMEIPEVLTGSIGIVIIVISILSSIYRQRR